MSRRVYKYEIPITGETSTFELSGPIVHIGTQYDGIATLWAESGQSEPQHRTFGVFGTGHLVPNGWTHRGTVIQPPFVFHVYEEPTKESK